MGSLAGILVTHRITDIWTLLSGYVQICLENKKAGVTATKKSFKRVLHAINDAIVREV